MSIEFSELSQDEKEQYHNSNKTKLDTLSKIDHIAKEIQRKEEIIFEQRVLKILQEHGLIVLPTSEEANHDAP